jgi:hypothetical protein
MRREVIACKGMRIKISDNVIENVSENSKEIFMLEYLVYGTK